MRRLFHYLCVIVAASTSMASMRQPQEGNGFIERHRIVAPYAVSDGRLAIGRNRADPGGLPSEAFLGVYLVGSDKAIRLSSPKDLEGRVAITTPAEALAYLRLFSSPRTYYMFSSPTTVEVVRRKRLSPSVVLGDAKFLRQWLSAGRPMLGVVPDGLWPEIDTGVRCERKGEIFLITRLVAWSDRGRADLMRITQSVSWAGVVGEEDRRQVGTLSQERLTPLLRVPFK